MNEFIKGKFKLNGVSIWRNGGGVWERQEVPIQSEDIFIISTQQESFGDVWEEWLNIKPTNLPLH